MATVYRATDRDLGRTVAIKVLSPDLAPLLGEHRFQREIEFAARLQHPGIVPLYEAGGSGAVRYYTMPFVTGETLRQRLDRSPQLPVDEAVHIALEVAEALRYAHEQGVVHRDIKPENILLTGERVQVADFGIAHAISLAGHDRLTSAGVAIGTPSYMSPEQATSFDTIDGRADIYSLGCLLFEMLTGQPPFTGATPQVVMARHVGEPAPSLTLLRPTVPAPIGSLVARTLAKSPADRPDAAQFLADLHAALTRADANAAPRSSRRRVAIAALSTLTAAAAGFALMARGNPPGDPDAVVVFPLTSPGTSSSDGKLVALLIGRALEHTEPLRWMAGWKELEPGVRDDPAALSMRVAERTAARMGAKWYIDGDLVPHGDSLSVILRLHDIADGSTRTASAGSLVGDETVQTATTLALKAVIPLLETLVGPTRHVDLASLTNRNPAAVALWLRGEQQMRSADFRGALDSYRRALALDSTLAVAALTGAGVAIWTYEEAFADSLAHLALLHSHGLPPRNLAYTRGLVSYLAGDADSAVAQFTTALRADSLWSHGWMMLGDTYHHLITSSSSPDEMSESAFRRSVELDPGFSPAIFHLAEAVLRRGDTRAGTELLRQFEREARDSDLASQLEMMLTCLERGPAAVDWDSMAVAAPQRVLMVAANFGTGAAHLPCARAAARALYQGDTEQVGQASRWAAFKWLHHDLVAGGQLAHATALTDSAVRSLTIEAIGLHILDAVELGADTTAALRAIDVIGSSLEGIPVNQLWHLAIWGLFRHDLPLIDSIRAELGSRLNDREAAVLRDLIDARRLLLTGDTTAAIGALASLRAGSEDVQWDLWHSMASEQLLRARLLLAKGRADEAFEVASRFDNSQSAIYLYYLPASLVVRRAAARQLGRGATVELMEERLRNLGRADLLLTNTVP